MHGGAVLNCTVGMSLAARGLVCACGAAFGLPSVVNDPIGAIQPAQASPLEDVLGGEL
jgi:hypothetical protein